MDRLAVIGNPIEHSRSPFIWHEFSQQTNIALEYDKIYSPIDEFEHVVSEFFAKKGKALNVTAPFKARAYALANNHDHASSIAKSANLLVNKDGVIQAYNTDGTGLVTDIKRNGYGLKDKNILFIGSGSVIYSVLDSLETEKPSRIDLLMRNWDNLDSFMQHSQLIDAFDENILYDVIINTTPNIPENILFQQVKHLATNALAYDMIYTKSQTMFMQQMQKVNAQVNCINGIGMLIQQAAAGFEIVYGIKPMVESLYLLLQGE